MNPETSLEIILMDLSNSLSMLVKQIEQPLIGSLIGPTLTAFLLYRNSIRLNKAEETNKNIRLAQLILGSLELQINSLEDFQSVFIRSGINFLSYTDRLERYLVNRNIIGLIYDKCQIFPEPVIENLLLYHEVLNDNINHIESVRGGAEEVMSEFIKNKSFDRTDPETMTDNQVSRSQRYRVNQRIEITLFICLRLCYDLNKHVIENSVKTSKYKLKIYEKYQSFECENADFIKHHENFYNLALKQIRANIIDGII